MATSETTRHRLWDPAIDGLLPGITGGIVFAAYLLLIGALAGQGPGQVFSRFGAEAISPGLGALNHLGVSAVYGALFGFIWSLTKKRILWAPLGLAYGLVVYAISALLILPALGSPLLETSMLHWAVAHGIYGLVLAWTMDRL